MKNPEWFTIYSIDGYQEPDNTYNSMPSLNIDIHIYSVDGNLNLHTIYNSIAKS